VRSNYGPHCDGGESGTRPGRFLKGIGAQISPSPSELTDFGVH
jgi:hypothetical protein